MTVIDSHDKKFEPLPIELLEDRNLDIENIVLHSLYFLITTDIVVIALVLNNDFREFAERKLLII